MKNEKYQKMKLLNAAPEKIVQSEIISFPCCLVLLRAGLDLDWLLQLDLLLGQLLDLLAEEGLAPGVGLPAAEVSLPGEAGLLSGVPSS